MAQHTRGPRQDNQDAVQAGEGHRGGVDLSPAEALEVERKLPPSVQVLHEAVRIQGELEMSRSTSALAWSSLAAGLSIGFSMLVPALLKAHLPHVPAAELVAAFGYSAGFLMVILARQQLFTENTTTAVLPLMTHPGMHALLRLLRLWGIVLLGNVVGGALFALAVTWLPMVEVPAHEEMRKAADAMLHQPASVLFAKAIVAGWLIATMVWLAAAAEGAKTLVVLLLPWLVGIGAFAHVVVGTVEGAYLLFNGQAGIGEVLAFFWPTLAGNVVGGSLIFALVSHAQVRSDAPEH